MNPKLPARKARPGDRVAAVLHATSEVIKLIGYGTYDGDHEPPFGPMGTPKAEFDKMVGEMKAANELPDSFVYTNPRITLDDGKIVWGMQCWWCSADWFESEFVKGRRIEVVGLPDWD